MKTIYNKCNYIMSSLIMASEEFSVQNLSDQAIIILSEKITTLVFNPDSIVPPDYLCFNILTKVILLPYNTVFIAFALTLYSIYTHL